MLGGDRVTYCPAGGGAAASGGGGGQHAPSPASQQPDAGAFLGAGLERLESRPASDACVRFKLLEALQTI